jgi:tetratricopeptide (TPR) repeat protein
MVAHVVLGLTEDARGDELRAIAEFQQAIEISGARPAAYLDYLGHAYAVAGRREEAQAVLSEIEKQVSFGGSVGPGFEAATLIALGQNDKALDALEEGCTHGDDDLIWLKVDPRYDPLRAKPRFQTLLHLAGFTQ